MGVVVIPAAESSPVANLLEMGPLLHGVIGLVPIQRLRRSTSEISNGNVLGYYVTSVP